MNQIHKQLKSESGVMVIATALITTTIVAMAVAFMANSTILRRAKIERGYATEIICSAAAEDIHSFNDMASLAFATLEDLRRQEGINFDDFFMVMPTASVNAAESFPEGPYIEGASVDVCASPNAFLPVAPGADSPPPSPFASFQEAFGFKCNLNGGNDCTVIFDLCHYEAVTGLDPLTTPLIPNSIPRTIWWNQRSTGNALGCVGITDLQNELIPLPGAAPSSDEFRVVNSTVWSKKFRGSNDYAGNLASTEERALSSAKLVLVYSPYMNIDAVADAVPFDVTPRHNRHWLSLQRDELQSDLDVTPVINDFNPFLPSNGVLSTAFLANSPPVTYSSPPIAVSEEFIPMIPAFPAYSEGDTYDMGQADMLLNCSNTPGLLARQFLAHLVGLARDEGQLQFSTEVLIPNPRVIGNLPTSTTNTVTTIPPTIVHPFGADLASRGAVQPFITAFHDSTPAGEPAFGFDHPVSSYVNPFVSNTGGETRELFSNDPLDVVSFSTMIPDDDEMKLFNSLFSQQLALCQHLYDADTLPGGYGFTSLFPAIPDEGLNKSSPLAPRIFVPGESTINAFGAVDYWRRNTLYSSDLDIDYNGQLRPDTDLKVNIGSYEGGRNPALMPSDTDPYPAPVDNEFPNFQWGNGCPWGLNCDHKYAGIANSSGGIFQRQAAGFLTAQELVATIGTAQACPAKVQTPLGNELCEKPDRPTDQAWLKPDFEGTLRYILNDFGRVGGGLGVVRQGGTPSPGIFPLSPAPTPLYRPFNSLLSGTNVEYVSGLTNLADTPGTLVIVTHGGFEGDDGTESSCTGTEFDNPSGPAQPTWPANIQEVRRLADELYARDWRIAVVMIPYPYRNSSGTVHTGRSKRCLEAAFGLPPEAPGNLNRIPLLYFGPNSVAYNDDNGEAGPGSNPCYSTDMNGWYSQWGDMYRPGGTQFCAGNNIAAADRLFKDVLNGRQILF